jgi:four helix bundle protein
MRDFRDLKVWHKAHQFALRVYQVTHTFPDAERFGLVSQLRRSAVSVPSNIAEGCGRSGDRELSHFLSQAAGSASEADYQLLLSRDLGYLSQTDHDELVAKVTEIGKMLNAFMQKLTPNC